MASLRPHHVQTESRRRSPQDDLVYYFHDLPENPGTADDFFPQWRSMARFAPGDLSARQVCLVLDRTRQAWTQHESRAFGRGFAARLQPEMAHWYAHAVPLLGEMDHRGLEAMLSGHAALGIMPDPVFMEAWVRRAHGKMADAEMRVLANVAMAFSSLGRPMEAGLRSSLFSAIERRQAEFTPTGNTEKDAERVQYLTKILWAMGVQDAIDPEAGTRYALLARQLAPLAGKFPEAAWKSQCSRGQLQDACLWFSLPNPGPAPYARGNTTSSLERDLLDVFERAQLRVLGADAAQLRKLGKKADFAVKTGAGVIHVEADGESHFVIHPDGRPRYNGKTVFQTALMHKLYPRFVFLRFPHAAFNGGAGQPGTVRRLFEVAARMRNHAGGAFVVAMDNGAVCLRRLTA